MEPQFEDTTGEEEEYKEEGRVESVAQGEMEQPMVGDPQTEERGETTVDPESHGMMQGSCGGG